MLSNIALFIRQQHRPPFDAHADSVALADEEFSRETGRGEMPWVHVRLLGEGQREKRFLKLQNACELLADGFEGFDDHMGEYVARVPLSARDSGNSDAERFLDWLETREDLDDEQREFVASLRARRVIELIAVKQRLAHVRFQELLSTNERLLSELDSNRKLKVHFNPTHVWSQFETRILLDEHAEIPATVLVFAVKGEVRAIALGAEAAQLLRELDGAGPTTTADLLRHTARANRVGLLDLVSDLARLGVVALGEQS